MATTVQDLLNEASKHVGATYNNGAGRTWSANVAAPPSFDCSGFIQYLGKRTGAGDPGSVSTVQYANAQKAGLAINIDQARKTPGALLYKPGLGNNGHVAMVYDAQGDTIEATGSGGGVRIIKGGANKKYFTQASLMAGVDYSGSYTPPTMAGGTSQIADSSVAPSGSNDVRSDPAFQLASLAALASGKQTADEIDANTTAVAGAPAGNAITPSTVATEGAGAGVDKTKWATDFLTAGGFPVTPANLKAIEAWQQAEGTKAGYNPLATTQKASGSTAFNTNGGSPVQNYQNYSQGIDATVQTINNGHYGNIVDALKSGTDPVAVGTAISQSSWGTGRGVLNVLHGEQ